MLAVPGVFLPGLIEDLEDALRAPAPPSGQRRFLGVRGPPPLALQPLQDLKGLKVRPDAAAGTGRGQLFLRGRAKPVRRSL